ncbi:MAG: PQQ-dependent dehydrogenase, methanol/ethanol family [Gammaproteobacteria bacterium]
MSTRSRTFFAFALALALLVNTGCGGKPRSTVAAAAPAAAAFDVSEERVERADESDSDNWLVHGRTYSEQRYSPLADIDSSSVSRLGLAWQLDLGTDRGLEATPLVVDGVMFTTGSWSRAYAIEARSGKLLWTYDPQVPGASARNGCCDVVSRGLAIWHGRVFLATFDGRLIALDARDGKLIWQVDTIVDRKLPYTITGAPRIVKGKVLIGNGGAEFGVRGYFSAYDVDSGKLAWRFFTVPAGPTGPFEQPELERAAKTWDPEHGAWPGKGGGTVWDSFAYDPMLDLLYVGTGNGGPWPQSVRSPSGGDNLFLSSILAVRPETGQLLWYYQTTPGDQWDFTATQHMILSELPWEGRTRKVLMQAPKNGFFYVLDRETGELLSAEKYAYVTWASHVDAKTGRPVLTEHAKYGYSGKETLMYPWVAGAHNWHPMSFSPRTGLVYIPAQQAWWVESASRVTHFDEQIADLKPFLRGQELRPTRGYLRAWDPVKRQTAWEVEYSTLSNGGTLVTAGDVVFQGSTDGNFSAYDARTGKLLKRLFTGTGIIAPPITYRVDGVQYVSVLAGFGGATFFMMDADNPARKYANTGRVLTFKLDGTSVPLPPVKAQAASNAPRFVMTADKATIDRGIELYRGNCGRCHGMLTSKALLPDLRELTPEKHRIFEDIVLGGALEARGMASFADALTKKDVAAIQAALVYLRDNPFPQPATVGRAQNIRPGR